MGIAHDNQVSSPETKHSVTARLTVCYRPISDVRHDYPSSRQVADLATALFSPLLHAHIPLRNSYTLKSVG
jgi:hypothetical protein